MNKYKITLYKLEFILINAITKIYLGGFLVTCFSLKN